MIGGVVVVILRVIVSDMYSGNELIKFMVLLMFVNGIVLVVVLIIGGIILNYFVWCMVFVILIIFGFVMVIGFLLKVFELLIVINCELSSGLKIMFKNFKILLKMLWFVLLMFI